MLLDDGRLVEDDNLPILELTRKHRSSVVHVVDPGLLANQALIDMTEDRLCRCPADGSRDVRGRSVSGW